MSKIRQSPKLPAEVRREQLLQAALRLFSEKGYRETSTQEVARAAGLTKGALYFHYPSKEDLLVALVHSINNQYKEAFMATARPGMSPGEILAKVIAVSHLPGLPDIRHAFDITLMGLRVPKVKALVARIQRERIRIYCRYVDHSLGYSAKDLENLAHLTFAVFHGIHLRRMCAPQGVSIPALLSLFDRLTSGPVPRGRRSAGKRGRR